MRLIVKADDFGFTEAINLGIIKAHKDGIVTSTALMVNMPAAKHAVELIAHYPRLCLGLHVNLVIGKPCAEPEKVKSLLQPNGHFISSKTSREIIAAGGEPILNYEEALVEIEAQLLKFYELTGKMPEYIEGHAIISDTVNKIYVELAKKYGLLHVSFMPEFCVGHTHLPVYTGNIYGWYDEGNNPEDYFPSTSFVTPNGKIPIACFHPGYLDKSIFDMSSLTIPRALDLYTLIHPNTLKWVENNQVKLISFRTIKKHV